MGKISQDIDDQLLDYLDGRLTPAERSAVEEILVREHLVRRRLEELALTHHFLAGQLPEEPSKNFAVSVMSRLEESTVNRGFSAMNGIILLSGILVAMGIGVWLLSAGVFDGSQTMVDLNRIPFSREFINQTLPSVSIDGKLIINTIMILNLALALLVLDRIILKPLFHRRIRTGH